MNHDENATMYPCIANKNSFLLPILYSGRLATEDVLGQDCRECIKALCFVVFLLPYSQLWWGD